VNVLLFLRIVEKKKAVFQEDIEKRNNRCYEERLRLLSSYERLTPVLNDSIKAKKNLLCTNEKEFMGSIYLYATDILLTIKQSSKLFQHIIRKLDMKRPPYSSVFLDRFAKDFVLLFFADFSSAERNVINILRQLEELIKNVFRNFIEGKDFSLYGSEDLMINRMLKAFINSADNRDYLNLLFGKLFDEATSMHKYLGRLYGKRYSINTKTIDNKEPGTLVITDHFREGIPEKSSTSDPNPKKVEEKINFEKLIMEPMEGENVLLICDGILRRITGKLIFMPLPMRYFCKMLETIVIDLV